MKDCKFWCSEFLLLFTVIVYLHCVIDAFSLDHAWSFDCQCVFHDFDVKNKILLYERRVNIAFADALENCSKRTVRRHRLHPNNSFVVLKNNDSRDASKIWDAESESEIEGEKNKKLRRLEVNLFLKYFWWLFSFWTNVRLLEIFSQIFWEICYYSFAKEIKRDQSKKFSRHNLHWKYNEVSKDSYLLKVEKTLKKQ
jgi:hypothetical protein